MFGEYILSHKKNIIVWLIVCALFALVFKLYGLPIAPVLYGALLSGFFGLVFLIIDFISYRRRRIILQRLAEEITLSADNIPLPRNGIEEEYTRLIHTLY
ncbi:MAG: sensor histidine kinase, partial [Huintestinicola sp.]